MQHALDLARPYWPLILAAIVYPIVTAALSWWLWWDTPAHWDAYAAAHPRAALAIRALRAVSPHFRKLVTAWRDYTAARSLAPVAPPSVGPLAPPVDPVAPPVPTPAEPSPVLRASTVTGRETIAPAEVSQEHYEFVRDGANRVLGIDIDQGGHVEGGAMLGACVLALAASLLCAGCPLVRDVAMRAAPGVPDPVGCVAGVQRCNGLIPVVCSATAREWSALPRSASGEPRTCAPGVCVVSDGVAHCAPAGTDGGAL